MIPSCSPTGKVRQSCRENEAGQLNEVRWVREFLCFCSEAIHSAKQPWGQRAWHEALVDMKLLGLRMRLAASRPQR